MSRISDQTVDGYLDAVSARRSTPGGGAVAAIVAAEACALLEMVLNFTQSEDARLTGMATRLSQTRPELLAMADRDMAAFNARGFQADRLGHRSDIATRRHGRSRAHG
ncbi:MAG: cyclodeaminase/cyclohydrolase family protein [Pseudomonadales bacterium]